MIVEATAAIGAGVVARSILVALGIDSVIELASVAALVGGSPSSFFHSHPRTVIEDRPRNSPSIGAKAKTIIVSLGATCVSVKFGSPSVRFDHTNTIGVQRAVVCRSGRRRSCRSAPPTAKGGTASR